MSNVIACAIAAAAHALGGWRVRAFGAGREFGGVLGVVLIARNTLNAIPNVWMPAIQIYFTNKKIFCFCFNLVFANHRASHVFSTSSKKKEIFSKPEDASSAIPVKLKPIVMLLVELKMIASAVPS